jgi:hypothetical protein
LEQLPLFILPAKNGFEIGEEMRLKQKVSSVITFVLLAALCAAAPVLAQEGAQVGVFADLEIPLETRVEVPVEVRDVVELYAVDLTIRFDPDILQVEDADPDRAGVQPGLATFLDAGMTLFNEVDNETGTVRFVMSQINPSEGKSGSGNLLVLYFVGKQAGTSQVTVEKVELANRLGEAIPVSGVDAEIVVSEGALEVVATPIPVQDQGQIIVIETLMPTEVPTAAPMPTAVVEVAQETGVPEVVAPVEPTAEPMAGGDVDSGSEQQPEEQGNGSLWWLLVLPLVIIVGVIFYTRRRKVDQPDQTDHSGGSNEK